MNTSTHNRKERPHLFAAVQLVLLLIVGGGVMAYNFSTVGVPFESMISRNSTPIPNDVLLLIENKYGFKDVLSHEEEAKVAAYRNRANRLFFDCWEEIGQKNSSEALEIAEKLTKRRGRDVASLFTLANANFDLEEFEPAKELYSEIIELAPDFSRAYSNRGRINMALEYYDDAIQDHEKAIELDETDPVNFFRLAYVYYDLKLFERAMELYNYAVELAPQKSSPLIVRSELHYLLGDFDAAFLDIEKALELNPERVDALVIRGFLHNRNNNHEHSLKDFTAAIKVNSKDGKTFYQRSIVYYDLNNYGSALADLNYAIELGFENAEIYNRRGLVNQKLERSAKAYKDFSRSLELDPRYVPALRSAAYFYILSDDYIDALPLLNRAIDLAPNAAAGYFDRGRALHSLGQFELAKADFNRVIEIEGGMAYSLNARGLASLEQGSVDIALDDFNAALVLDPNHHSSLVNRANAYAVAGQKEKARTDFENAVESMEENGYGHANYAKFLLADGEFSSAVKFFSKVIGQYPNFAESYSDRAEAYRGMGDIENAERDIAIATELEQEFPHSKDQLPIIDLE
jgi:tetratricopeptide (TPR) repeat protein